jgi:hypothetical protein
VFEWERMTKMVENVTCVLYQHAAEKKTK